MRADELKVGGIYYYDKYYKKFTCEAISPAHSIYTDYRNQTYCFLNSLMHDERQANKLFITGKV